MTLPKLPPYERSGVWRATLEGLMRSRNMSNEILIRELQSRGVGVNHDTIRKWRRGQTPTQWQVILPVLGEIFGVRPAVFVEGVHSQPPRVPPTRFRLFRQALRHHMKRQGVTVAQVAQACTEFGFPTGRPTVSHWLNRGSVPTDGVAILPYLAEYLATDVDSLIPTGESWRTGRSAGGRARWKSGG